MHQSGTKTSGTAEDRQDLARFFATWVRHPMKMGAVAPSSRSYCDAMVRLSNTRLDGPILELGPGLGAVTKALLRAGVEPQRITSIEYDREFAAALAERFPKVGVVCGDGFDLDATLDDGGETKFATILLAIPIVRFSMTKRQALLQRYLDRLLPGGNVTQLSYLWKPPVDPVPGRFTVSSSDIIWRNLPPARVWVYTPERQQGA